VSKPEHNRAIDHFLDPNGHELAVWSGTPRNLAEVSGS
jgi:hypothetical protein